MGEPTIQSNRWYQRRTDRLFQNLSSLNGGACQGSEPHFPLHTREGGHSSIFHKYYSLTFLNRSTQMNRVGQAS
jgi:hypothetical protein